MPRFNTSIRGTLATLGGLALAACGGGKDPMGINPTPPPPPPPPTFTYTFNVFEANDHDSEITSTGTLTIDGKEVPLVNGEFVYEGTPKTVQVDFTNNSHTNNTQTIYTKPSPGEIYGEQLVATWVRPTMSLSLQAGDSDFEIFAYNDNATPRSDYHWQKALGSNIIPHAALCVDTNDIPFAFDDVTFDPVATVVKSVSRDVMTNDFPNELSQLRFAPKGIEMSSGPSPDYLAIVGRNDFAPPGFNQGTPLPNGCLIDARYQAPGTALQFFDRVAAKRELFAAVGRFGNAPNMSSGNFIDIQSGELNQRAEDFYALNFILGAQPASFWDN